MILRGAPGDPPRLPHTARVAPVLRAVLVLLALAGAAFPPVGSALAIMTSRATVTANTLSAAPAFPRCYGDAVLGDNPVGYWRLDETSGANAADGVAANTGTYTNEVTLGQAGALPETVNNKAATFDGVDDYVALGNAAALQLGNGTAEAWIKTSNAGTGAREIVGKLGAYAIYLQGNVLATYDWTTSTEYSTGIKLADSTWHHVAVTFQSGVANGTKIYADGVLRGTATITVSDQSSPLLLGNESGSSKYFTGSIDDAAVYGSALTASQIRSHYNSGRCYLDGVLADNPAAYWRLGEAVGNIAADGIRGRDGTYANGPTLNQTGGLNGDSNPAVTFDGVDDYVTVPYNAALNPAQFTVEAWAEPTDISTKWRAVVSSYKGNSTGTGTGFWLGTDGTSWLFETFNGTWNRVIGATVVLGSWAHLVGTYDGTTVKLYVNGILSASAAGGYTANNNAQLSIGATRYTDTGWANQFTGSLDEVAIYNAALSQTRIQAHYLLARSYQDTVLDSKPAGYWRLGEGSGTTAADVLNANAGTYENGPGLGQPGGLAGEADTAASFDGVDDDVLGPNAFGYSGRAPMSVEFWLNPSTAGQNGWRGIVSKQSGTPTSRDGWAVWLGPANDATYGNRIAFDRWLGTTHHFFSGTIQLAVGSWYHGVVTYDGSTVKFYANGAFDTSGAEASPRTTRPRRCDSRRS